MGFRGGIPPPGVRRSSGPIRASAGCPPGGATGNVGPVSIDLLLPLTLGFLAAWCFAGAAVLQHHAVRQTVVGRMRLTDIGAFLRRPGWWLGLVLGGGGAALHIAALTMAPMALVQPLGVLAIPAAVLVVGLRARRRPPLPVVLSAALCVLSIAVFVLVAAPELSSPVPQLRPVVLGAAVVAGVVAGLAGWARTAGTGWWPPVALALAGAMAFGLVAGLVKTAALLLEAGGFGPAVLGLGVLAVLAALVGGWLVQQAYAAGPPEVVLACLTVVDPVVAVVLGLVLLGEGSGLAAGTVVGMSLAGLAAAGGALTLARRHPDARPATRVAAPATERTTAR